MVTIYIFNAIKKINLKKANCIIIFNTVYFFVLLQKAVAEMVQSATLETRRSLHFKSFIINPIIMFLFHSHVT